MNRTLPSLVLATSLCMPSLALASDTDALARAAWRHGNAALHAVDATPEQRRAVGQAAERLAQRLQPLGREVHDWARTAHAVWTSQTVTHSAVESVRVDAVDLIDDASAESVDFVVEVADVLTPEQREDLVELAHSALRRLLRG